LKRTPGALLRRLNYKHAALCGFLQFFRRVGMISAPVRVASRGDDLTTDYVKYPRHNPGLAPNSVLVRAINPR
jgi:hypothetical protein